jgi:isoleucyl-tRNA synthetase
MSKIENPNVMDKWILSATQSLIKYVRAEMEAYKLYMVVRPLLTFLEKLSNWYVRLNRTRMKGEEGSVEQQRSLNVLFEVLLNTNILMASITPFLTENMYQNMRNGISDADEHLKAPSIHFLQIPEVDESRIDKQIEEKVARMQSAIENGRLIRERNNLPIKTPLSKVILVDADKQNLQDYMDVK